MAGGDRVAPAAASSTFADVVLAVFVNFELSENAIPSVVEIEDRDVKHK
jgi:hypothetical protein